MKITGKLFIQKNQLLLGKAIAQKTQYLGALKATRPESHRFKMLNNELRWLNTKDKAIIKAPHPKAKASASDAFRADRQLERALNTVRYPFNNGPC